MPHWIIGRKHKMFFENILGDLNAAALSNSWVAPCDVSAAMFVSGALSLGVLFAGCLYRANNEFIQLNLRAPVSGGQPESKDYDNRTPQSIGLSVTIESVDPQQSADNYANCGRDSEQPSLKPLPRTIVGLLLLL